jgi:MoaA/NifB/PqqE/SkfB family radical SAM enzyme
MVGRNKTKSLEKTLLPFIIGTNFIPPCNNNCVFCAALQEERLLGKDTESVKSEMRQIKCKGFKEVILSGGEPTIRSDIIELLSYAKELGYKEIYLQTNGRMFYYPEFTKKVVDAGCNVIQVGLHAPTAELHDQITRAPGSFEQTVQGIKNLLQYRDRVFIQITVLFHKMNYKHLPALARFISKEFKGIRMVTLLPIDITGNAKMNMDKLLVRMTNAKPYLEKGLSILKENGFSFCLDLTPFCVIDKKFWTPFCVIDKKFWKSIKPREIKSGLLTHKAIDGSPSSIFKSCNGCIMKNKCPGTWQSYASEVGTDEFKPIKSR